MVRSPRFIVVVTLLMMVSVACARAHLDFISPAPPREEIMAHGIAEEALRPGAAHPWTDIGKVCLAFVVGYYGWRILAATALLLHTFAASRTGHSRGNAPSSPDLLMCPLGYRESSLSHRRPLGRRVTCDGHRPQTHRP